MAAITIKVFLFGIAILASLVSADSQTCPSCDCDTTKQYQHVLGNFGTRVFNKRSGGNADVEIQNRMAPTYFFEYQTDSCDLQLSFAEFTLNRRLLALHAHCADKHWNWNNTTQSYVSQVSEAQLGDISRTRWFTASSGDTIGFHRRWLLSAHSSGDILTTYWHSPVSLYYSVDLIDSATGQRLILLDSFAISSTVPSRKPHFYSMYPLDSRIRQVLPTFIGTNRSLAMRVRVFSSPSEAEHWTRSDVMTYAPSLVGEKWYRGTWKRIAAENAAIQNGSCGQFVATVQGGCTVAPLPNMSGHELAIATPSGDVVHTQVVPSGSIFVALTQGAYIVMIRQNNVVVCTNLIYIN